MNHFDDVCGLHLEARKAANLETFQRFISKGDDPLCCIKEEDAKEIKNAIKGMGKLLAVANGRRALTGNHKYVLFIKEKEGVKVYLYTVLNGLYNEMGPFKDLDTALSNADCYGLFEECKKIASMKVLGDDMNKKLFEEIVEEYDDWDSEGYDDVFDGDMEDWDWEDYDDEYGGTDPHADMSNHLADCFPTRDSEYQDDDGDYDPFSYVQMGDGEGGIGKRTKPAAYANRLKSGDNAPTFDDGTVLGGDFDNDETDVDFAMSDDADLDAWAREE